MLRRSAAVMGGMSVYATGVLAAYVYFSEDDPDNVPSFGTERPFNRESLFNRLAPTYDQSLATDETILGISLLRKYLMKHSCGNVLEVCAGTCRNVSRYPDQIESLTMIDTSLAMLRHSKDLSNVREPKVEGDPVVCPTKRFVMDAEALPFSNDQFDTVVDTFGLCSVEHPVQVVREMARVCKPGGKLLFLERGKSTRGSWLDPYVNMVLDKYVSLNEAQWGSTWNRDIEGILDAAGVEIGQSYHWHLGTTYYIVAHPKASSSASKI